jgi:murein DD-endopeptidase MepM/ murein hydrolase activator NlpD
MTLAKRIGWGLGLFLLLIAAAFASMVRIRFDAPAQAVREQSGGMMAADSSLIIPVQGVRADQLSDTWGDSRGGGNREHHAIDIMAPKGTPVLAAASGTVEKIFESANGGHTIYVRTPDGGTIHYYAHLDSYGVTEKQIVRQGQAIATVGNTGSAAGGAPHLHFEIKVMQLGEGWWQGTNVNPYPLLARSGQ